MVQQVKVLATKPDNLGSMPRTHSIEGKSQLVHESMRTCRVNTVMK